MGAYQSNPQQQQQQTATYSAYNAYNTYNNTYNLILNLQLSDVNLHNTIATTTANDSNNPRTSPLNRDGNVINANNKINYQSLNGGNSHSVISQPSTYTISSIINSNQFDSIDISSHLNKSKNKQSINKGDAYLNNITTDISLPINAINNNSFTNAGGDDKSSKMANSNLQVNNNINGDCNNTNNTTNSTNDTISQHNSNSTHQIIRQSKLSAIQGGVIHRILNLFHQKIMRSIKKTVLDQITQYRNLIFTFMGGLMYCSLAL